MDYKEKQQIKLERYQELSQKAELGSKQAFQRSHAIGEAIPLGQPILVGHHSEGRHRRDIDRIHNQMNKSIELQDKAEYYKKKAENILNPTAISSDDPEAINKLKEKIDSLEKKVLRTKDLNSKLRKFKDRKNALIEVEKMPDSNPDKKMFAKMLDQSKIYAMPPDRIGAYYLDTVSINAEIRRLKDRIKNLENLKAIPETEETIKGVTIKTDKEANRVKLFFPSIPSKEVRDKLKHNGFRWSPFNQCWQAYLKEWNITRAKEIIQGVEV